jgi:hypothetical protein
LVVTSAPEAEPSSRRTLLGAAAGAGLLVLSACGSSGIRARVKKVGTVPALDVPILNHLLDVELLGIAAYTAGIPLLASAAQDAAKQFLLQELSHAGELAGLVKEAHRRPHELQPSYALGHPRTAHDVLVLLHGIERAQLNAYLDAIPRLSGGPVRAAAAALLANDAQHVAVLRTHLGEPPIPAAFVTGLE